MKKYLDSEILNILTEIRAISLDTRDLINVYRQKWDVDVYDAVIQTNTVSAEELKSVLANYLGLNVSDSIDTISIPSECMEIINFSHAHKWSCIPLGIKSVGKKNELHVLIADPSSRQLINEMRETTDCILNLTVGTRQEIRSAIFMDYPLSQQLVFTCARGGRSEFAKTT